LHLHQKPGNHVSPSFKTGFFLLAVTFIISAQTPDSVHITLVDAEQIFLQKNLSLLAEKYNIDISKAQVQQAKYRDNPVLNTDQNIYDGKFFRHNKDFGQVYVQLQQLIKTASKRNKLIQLANDDVLSAQQQFNDLMRNRRFILRNDFSTLNLQFKTWNIYTSEITSRVRYQKEYRATPLAIENLMVSTSDGAKVPLKEIADIKSLTGPAFIFRDNNMRHIAVKFSVRERDLGSTIAEAQQKVDDAVHLPTGYKMSWNGEFENQQRATKTLGRVVPVCLLPSS
jgi:hypothetical protein